MPMKMRVRLVTAAGLRARARPGAAAPPRQSARAVVVALATAARSACSSASTLAAGVSASQAFTAPFASTGRLIDDSRVGTEWMTLIDATSITETLRYAYGQRKPSLA